MKETKKILKDLYWIKDNGTMTCFEDTIGYEKIINDLSKLEQTISILEKQKNIVKEQPSNTELDKYWLEFINSMLNYLKEE